MNQHRWAVIAAVLVLAAIVGGIAYNIGVSQGIAQSGKIVASPGGPFPYPYYGWHPWGFGFFLFPLFFFAFSIHAEARAKRLIIRVIDTGNGIPSEELPRIFERFHKGGDSHGSGLAIARTLVVAHHGDIHIESVVGRGTTVTVSLPA